MALAKKASEEKKPSAVAFVNWSLPTVDGKSIRSSKGFPIFQNPLYPNRQEDALVNLAKKHGGSVTVQLECRIMLNTHVAGEEIDIDSIAVIGDPTEAAPANPLQ